MRIWKNFFWTCIRCAPLVLASSGLCQITAASDARSTVQLRQILITDSVESAQQLGEMPDAGFVVVASPKLPFLNAAELKRRLTQGQGKDIDDRLLAGIVLVIEAFVRETDFAAATAIIPPQNIGGGIVRVAVHPGRIRDVKLQGAQWFSESLLREKLRLERGDPIRISELDRAITWTNSNPFRRVRVHIQPIADTGEADLIINVDDRRPVRVFASYDNTGNEVLGENRYALGLNWGNAWGRDHQASYQFITSDNVDVFRAHSTDYRVPLPWRHVAGVSASYVQANPTFYDGLFTQRGESITADLKYIVPFNKQRWKAEVIGGVGFKQTNNNLEFSGMPQIGATIHVLSGNIGAAAVREDSRGSWSGSAILMGSPGSFNSRSRRAVYDESRPGANPRFLYGLVTLQRNTALTPRLSSHARAMLQASSANLVPTEQFSLGGAATVRGYDERILSGDAGYSFTHELQQRFPAIVIGKRVPKLDMSGVFFWDYGRVVIKHPLVGQRGSDYLASVGLGLRASIGNYVNGAVEVARQLEEVEIPGVPHHRVHVRFSVSY